MDWILDLLTTYIHHSKLHFTDHWHIPTIVLSLLPSPLAVCWQRLLPRDILQLPALRSSCHSRLTEFLISDNSTNWVPDWRPFHTNLIILSSQADFQLNSLLTNQLLHVTSLNWTADKLQPTINKLLQTVLLITTRHEPPRKHRFHCYRPTIPGQLHAYPLSAEPLYWAFA
jgi:hypothetical protein